MFPSIYEHWGITLTVIGCFYLLLVLLWCRLLGFNDDAANIKLDTSPRPENSNPQKTHSDPEKIRSVRATELGGLVRPDCRAKELLHTSGYAQCLTKDNEGCPHRLGDGQASQAIFCHHPRRDIIVARTDPKDA